MKKNQKVSIRSSILVLLLITILLISSSYAWFTANRTVTIDTITVNVQASNGLEISADAVTWGTILTNSDITGASSTYSGAVNQFPSTLAPCSSAGGVTSGKLDIFEGAVDTDLNTGEFILSATKGTDANGTTGTYIAFDVFFRITSASTLYITTASDMEYAGSTDLGLQNAARIAFINEGNAASTSSSGTFQALNNGTTAQIWEPNSLSHTAAAVAAASEYYNITTSTSASSALDPYYAIKAACTNQPLVQRTAPSSTYFSSITPAFVTPTGFTTAISFTNLAAGVTKYRIYMWIEGQDVDCQNYASGTSMTFNLQFSLDAT